MGGGEHLTLVDDIVGQLTRAGWLTDSVFFPHTQNRISFEGGAIQGPPLSLSSSSGGGDGDKKEA